MVGDQVKRARVARGLSQEAAAKLAGVPRKQVWKLENDRLVTIETFRRVVTALEMPVVTFGSVAVLPGDVDTGRVLAAAEETLAALRNLVTLLQATRAQVVDRSPDELLEAAAADVRPPITEDHPTVKMLHELVDRLAATKSRARP